MPWLTTVVACSIVLSLACAGVFLVGFRRRRFHSQLVIIYAFVFIAVLLANKLGWIPRRPLDYFIAASFPILGLGFYIVWHTESQRR